MITNVIKMSRKEFVKLNWQTPTITRDKSVFISIYGHLSHECYPPIVNDSLWRAGIYVQFDDIDEEWEHSDETIITSNQAREIVGFIKHYHQCTDPIDIYVHCYAGVSRSSAVSTFINDVLNLEIDSIRNLLTYNTRVYDELMKVW